MYERSYGYRYDEPGKNATTTDIAKVIRRDIKQAVQEGLLPSRWTYSVRSPHGTSIDVEVKDCADAWQDCDGTVPGSKRSYPDGSATFSACPYHDCKNGHQTLTEEARVAEMTLKRIHNAYNHDGSEVMVDYFDVRYYGTVQFEDARSADFRARMKAEDDAKRAAREAGEPCGYYVNYSREGRQTVHIAIRTPEGKIVLACGARTYRSGLGGLSKRDHEVTCSRCAKRAATFNASAPVAREP